MSSSDPIADFLTRIRNAHQAKHDRLDAPVSKVRLELCRILKEEGFIGDYEVVEGSPLNDVRVTLAYHEDGEPAIQHMRRISRGGRRVYRGAKELKPVLAGIGVEIISTSQGLLTDQQARERGVGGEVLCEIW
ncbi:MAG: 30S ribosomal protein S8 [Deltaproteobacteria bacterium]|nr:30S ribosomal protein S8 [Deltaproteobacteria bacterium]